MKKYIKSARQQETLEFALKTIMDSFAKDYLEKIILFGSCARGEEDWDSDVDILIQLNPKIRNEEQFKRKLLCLRSEVTPENLQLTEVDLKIVFGEEWLMQKSTFYENICREGIIICN